MITKKHVFYIISIGFLVICIAIFFLLDNKNLANTKPTVFIESNKLMNAFNNDEKKANKLYTGKVIEVAGTIQEINYLNKKTTLILNTDYTDSSIICELNNDETKKLIDIDKNKKILIKGICKGFLKDIILLNCYLETNKTYE